MGLLDAVVAAGFIGEPSKKRYSEVLSQKLTQEVSARRIHNRRNPHTAIGEDIIVDAE